MEHNLLIFSDVHLGCDLVQHLQPNTPLRTPQSAKRDEDLVQMLDWYRLGRSGTEGWRLVIAGDFIDFVGMSVSGDVPDEDEEERDREAPVESLDASPLSVRKQTPALVAGRTTVSDEERAYGLGSSEAHTLVKLRHVVRTHEDVFAAIARFVSEGNELVIIRGNHDVDLHWPQVQAALRHAIVERVPGNSEGVGERIVFSDWFYYERDRIFIEHGHQYDPYCSHAFHLRPVDLGDPERSSRSLADVLKRYVVNPTHGLTETGHEDATLADYLLFGGRLGVFGCVQLVRRFFVAVCTLVAAQWQRDAALLGRLATEQELRIRQCAQDHELCFHSLNRVVNLWCKPGNHSVLGVLRSLMLDRALLLVGSISIVLLPLLVAGDWTTGLTLSGSAALLSGTLGMLCWNARASVNSSTNLRESAACVADWLSAAVVVMGHTHLPERSGLRQDAIYVNLGSWAEADADGGVGAALPASRTHLVVPAGSTPTPLLYVWEREGGPREFHQPAAPSHDNHPVGKAPPRKVSTALPKTQSAIQLARGSAVRSLA